MSLIVWIIFGVIMGLIILANFFFFRNKDPKKKTKNQEDDIIAPKFKTKDPWQKRNLFNGFLYYVGQPAIWFVGVSLIFYVIVNGF